MDFDCQLSLLLSSHVIGGFLFSMRVSCGVQNSQVNCSIRRTAIILHANKMFGFCSAKKKQQKIPHHDEISCVRVFAEKFSH